MGPGLRGAPKLPGTPPRRARPPEVFWGPRGPRAPASRPFPTPLLLWAPGRIVRYGVSGAVGPQFPWCRPQVAGLGNPGLPGTRHSVGMAVLGQLARRLGAAESWARDRRCAADLALAALGDAQLVLLRSRRLMNANGRSVARAGESRAPAWGAQGPEGMLGCGLGPPPSRAPVATWPRVLREPRVFL